MGFFDKKSSSRTTNNDATTNNVDNRLAENGDIGGNISVNLSNVSANSDSGTASLGGSGGGVTTNITTSDFGALDAASELSDRAFSFAESAVGSSAQTSADAISKAVEVAKTATNDESARTQQLIILAVGGVGLAFALRGVLKKVFK